MAISLFSIHETLKDVTRVMKFITQRPRPSNKEAQLSDLRNHTIAIKQRIADKISVYLFVTIYIVCFFFFHVQFEELILADYVIRLNSSTYP